MGQFKYTLPSGATFTMDAPEGTTRADADYIFYSQVASGSLVGFVPGQSIGSVPSTATKFALSRLDRGTAGVDDRVILSIIAGLPTIAKIPNLINVPLENPINQADLAKIGDGIEIGPLNANQVQGLLAQVANFVDQPATTVDQETGIGIYGMLCEQLEQAGYVKPGTYLQFIAVNPDDFIATMNSPGVWTDLNGINSLDGFLNSSTDQNTAQLTLMQSGYDSLTATGSITPPPSESLSASQGYVYTQSGLQTISILSVATGVSLNAALIPAASFVALASTPLASLLSSPLTNIGSLASGAINNAITSTFGSFSPALSSALTKTVTEDIGALVTNASKYGTTAATDWAKSAEFGDITNLNATNLASGLDNLTGLNIGSTLTGYVQDIKDLDILGKASQYASSFSNPFSSLSNLGGLDLANFTSGFPDVSSLTSALPSFGSSLGTNLSSLSLSSFTSSIPGLSSLGNFSSLSSLPGLSILTGFAGSFFGGGDLVSGTKIAAGYSNTVDRSVVDAAVTRLLGNSKIPTPQFDFPVPGSQSLNASADITAAQNFLQNLRTQSNQLFSQAQNAVNSVGSTTIGDIGGFLRG